MPTERVLVVHDDPRKRRAIAACLATGGYDVVQARLAAALDRLRHERFDLLVASVDGAVDHLRLSALAPLLDIADALVSETSLASAAAALLDRVRIDGGAEAAWLVLDDDPAAVEVSGAGGLEPAQLGQIGHLLLARHPQSAAPRVLAAAEAFTGVRRADTAIAARVRDEGWEQVVVVPLAVKGRRIGAVIAAGRRGRLRSDAPDLRYLSTLAAQTAIAIENARLYHRARSQSLTDPHTGLPNARYLREHLEALLGQARQSGRPFSLLFVDSDSLKMVNDRFGHQAGDLFVSDLAQTLKGRERGVRATDTVVRYAGDEFVVLMPDTDGDQAAHVAERLRAEVCGRPFGVGGAAMTCTISLGVATFPTDAGSADDLLRAADNAMYEAKRRGKNQTVRHAELASGPASAPPAEPPASVA